MKQTRTTVAKTTILDIIKKSTSALSHTEILSKSNGMCDRVTIYRVLERLVNEDYIHKIVTTDGTVKYASCNHNHQDHNHHNHIHFSCEKCSVVTCLDDIIPTFKTPKDYIVKDMNFTLTGICPKCN